MSTAPLLDIDRVSRVYDLPREALFAPRPQLRAVNDLSLSVEAGKSSGLIGESGCGKSTLARMAMALERPTSGTVRFRGDDLFAMPPRALRRARRAMQIVFQDPYGSLDPRRTVGWTIAEPLSVLEGRLPRGERRARIAEALETVGLQADHARRYPHEFSGGQRQRIAIARALVTRPELVVADEPVSALDVSVQAQILNLLTRLREERGLTFLFISHDLTVVRHVTDTLAVMYLGRIVEEGPTKDVFSAPAHPYTGLLLSSVPQPDPANRRRGGTKRVEPAPPPVGGCAFAPRCARASARCREEIPQLDSRNGLRRVACFHPLPESV